MEPGLPAAVPAAAHQLAADHSGRRRVDRESVLCYCLMVLAFVADASLLMLALPLSAFLYALVSVKPSKRYFQASEPTHGWGRGCC